MICTPAPKFGLAALAAMAGNNAQASRIKTTRNPVSPAIGLLKPLSVDKRLFIHRNRIPQPMKTAHGFVCQARGTSWPKNP
jgi:hypothetical protein